MSYQNKLESQRERRLNRVSPQTETKVWIKSQKINVDRARRKPLSSQMSFTS
jgi:hypothetical protein